MSITLETKVDQLTGVGTALLGRLKKIKIETVRDLIFYYPYKYLDYSKILKIGELQPETSVTVVGKIELISSRRSKRRRQIVTEALLTDDSGSVKIVWFNQPWLTKNLRPGIRLMAWGKVDGGGFDQSLMNPEFEVIGQQTPPPLGILPMYSLVAGLTVKQLRLLIKRALEELPTSAEILPKELIEKEQLVDLPTAIKQIHFPETMELLTAAKARLAFDELFILRLWSINLRAELEKNQAPAIEFREAAIKEFVQALPFEMTADQKRAAWEILKDLKKTSPMNRLLDGDVGSGKTLVALLAMYNTALNNLQSVLMAPTEILAYQHYFNLAKLLAPFKINHALLTGSQKYYNGEPVKAAELLEKIGNGEAQIIIGTHALIQKKVNFSNLGLVVIDEQHRFGVKQRQILKEKNPHNLIPHFLSLTATPIPRSLSLVLFGDLDISVIKQMPAGRQPIITKVVPATKRLAAYEFINQQIIAGRQVFVICPLIDPSDKLGFRSVLEEHEKLDQQIFPDISVGLLHGRLKSDDKEEVMRRFNNNEIKILVSTSVVEVGVDVPNATVMMIEGADRFGLAQLHQFRGRVGRGEHQSFCFLFSDNDEEKTLERLNFLASCSDGFKLSEYDLSVRGGGSIFGEEQSGFFKYLRLADFRDVALLRRVQESVIYFNSNFELRNYSELQRQVSELGSVLHLE